MRPNKKYKIAIIEFKHETNTFSTHKTTIDDFRNRYLLYGDELLSVLGGTTTEISGFIDACREHDAEILPVIAANATPGGTVSDDVYKTISTYILNFLAEKKGKYNAILFSMHGAMVTESELDPDGELLHLIRGVIGNSVPLFATLDLHANVSQRMIDNADAFFPYETYPHVDQYEKAYEAANRLFEHLDGAWSPVMVGRGIPILTAGPRTGVEPLNDIEQKIKQLKQENKDLILASILQGFSWADTPDTGMGLIVVTKNNPKLANETIAVLEKEVLLRRDLFDTKDMLTPFEAIEFASKTAEGPIVFSDRSDNPGSGCPCDTTFILRALVEKRVENAAFAIIVDPETVDVAIKVGVGNTAEFNIGGKLEDPEINGYPVNVIAKVKTITDGEYINKSKMAHGVINHLGRTVVLDINGLEVIVTEKRVQPWDLEVYRRMGIDPTEKKILVVKSAMHFRASFDSIAKAVITIDCLGLASTNFKLFKYKYLKSPIFPIDR